MVRMVIIRDNERFMIQFPVESYQNLEQCYVNSIALFEVTLDSGHKISSMGEETTTE